MPDPWMLAVGAALAGVVLGALLAHWLRPDRSAALAQAESARAVAEAEREAARARAEDLSATIERERATLDGYRAQQTTQAAEIATLKERLDAQARALADGEAARTAQAAQFRALAAETLEATTKRLTEASAEKLDPMLMPLRERLAEFQRKVEETYQAEARERFSLKQEIGKALSTTDSLSRALRGQAQMRGALGETLLEQVLQAAGLQRDLHYVAQGEGMGLRAADGTRQKPDIIVNLPDGKCVVIDSKVALVDFAAWTAAEDEAARIAALSRFVAAVRGHVADLAGKRYQDNEALRTPDFVLLYMPFEQALAVAMQADPDLFATAWQKRVAIVGPNTLVVTLRVVERVWRYETNRENAEKIAAEASRLFEQLAAAAGFLEDSGRAIDKARAAHDDVVKRLFTGRENVARKAEALKALGVRSRKDLPAAYTALGGADAPADAPTEASGASLPGAAAQ